ncbi:hypothetical protein FHG87_007868 [Trinorchestia longiramus]|nr:hypothetical protein FHG87_007868 [Trinorchestia longiramus]
MAAPDDSLTKFEGKLWTYWTRSSGISNLLSLRNTDDHGKPRPHASTSLLKKEDMATYGYCPVWEDFYLIVCDLCGVSVKPQALKHHIEQQHGLDKVYLNSSERPCDAVSAATTATTSSATSWVSSRQESKQSEASDDSVRDVASCVGNNSSSSNKTLKRLLEKNTRRSPTSSFLVGDRREPSSSLSLYNSSGQPDLPSDVPHVGLLPTSLTAVTTNTRHTRHDSLSSNSSNHNSDSYIHLRAALDGAGPENSNYSLFENGGLVARAAPQVSNSLPYSNCSNVRVSHGSMSNSLSCRSTSRCSSSNSHGSNSTISNKLGLGISNGLDYNEGNTELIGRNNPSRTVVSPVLDFPSPSRCSLSKDDEDSLDSRLRALHSPQDLASPSLIPSSSLLPNLPSDGTCRQALPLENNPLNQPQPSLPDLSLDSNSLLNPSPHYTGQLSVEPQSVGPHSVDPHSVGPPSVGPPSIGPPSIGSIGPPSVGSSGMTSNHGALNTNRPNSMNTNISNGSNNDFCGILSSISPSGVMISMDNQMSDSSRSDSGNNSNTPQLHATPPMVNNAEEEEVKKISAMLQKEAEALAASQHLNSRSRSLHSLSTNTLPAHDIVEAQGLAGRRHHSSSSTILGVSSQLPHSSPAANHGLSNSSVGLANNGNDFSPLHSSVNTSAPRRASNSTSQLGSTNINNNNTNNNNTSSNSNMGSVPVPIGHMSVETLNQIQADLLATVSESDLNAVLNATPDSSDPSLLPNNSSLVYFPDNQSVQFSDSSLLNSDNFPSNPLSSSGSLSQVQFSNDELSMPVIESGGDSVASGLQPSSFRSTSLLDQSSDQLRMSDASQSDELANAVNSITQSGQNGCVNAFDSPAGSFMQPNSHLPIVVSSPLPSPSVSFCSVSLAAASPLSVSSVSSLPMTPLWAASLACARPPRAHSDNFYTTTAPQPLATCSYNTRRLGGFLASEHKNDLLRSVIRTALKKPSPTQYVIDSSSSNTHTGVSTPSSGALSSAVAERLNNVKPLLARKLQATVPLNALAVSKDGITVGTGYNGHIQVAANSLGIVGTVAGGQLKRGVHHIESIASKNANNLAKNKNKKAKISENGPGLNLLNSVVQIDTSGNAKNHGIPVVAVTIPNGLSTQQTFNISNVNFSGVRTAGTSQPIRIHPTSMKTYVRDQITGENRPTTVAGVLSNVAVSAATPVSAAAVGQTISTDGANIVLGSGTTSYLIADGLKSFKGDSSGGIRLELHPSNAFATDSRFIHATQLSKVVTSSGVVAASGGGGSGSTSIPINSQQQQQQPQQQQVTYLAPAVASGTNQHLTLQQVQQSPDQYFRIFFGALALMSCACLSDAEPSAKQERCAEVVRIEPGHKRRGRRGQSYGCYRRGSGGYYTTPPHHLCYPSGQPAILTPFTTVSSNRRRAARSGDCASASD